ncbi:MATE family efflux transporter [Rhodobacteraceae bacterium D3-12]|nr:MATE family efflux transporter [Rhodobacteraceae bacterium D3-12]
MSDLSPSPAGDNIYLRGALLPLFAKTALPIVLIMLVNGLFTVVDAYFLGTFVGADALVAVTLMFPFYMLIVALSTLVSSGFSSVYARHIGAENPHDAAAAFTSALGLAAVTCLVLMAGDWLIGPALSRLLAGGPGTLADLGHSYIRVVVLFSPLTFLLALNVDVLRARGRLSAMTGVMLLSALLNIVFDWLMVVRLGYGVVGSAYGTAMAQGVALLVVFALRQRADQPLRLRVSLTGWPAILSLGAPNSLGYVGLSLSAGLTLTMLQVWAADTYAATSGAFGILTRLMTFTFLPLLGLSMALQTITGNSFGSGDVARSRSALKTAAVIALIYCAAVQAGFLLLAPHLGGLFVADGTIQTELARILPLNTLTMVLFGPLMMIATYYQAIGDAQRAGLLGLSRTYAFGLPLIALLPLMIGEWGIWLAGPLAELLVLGLTLIVARPLLKG